MSTLATDSAPTPVVKWVGGKRQLQDRLLPILQAGYTSDSTYFEPFLGGGAMFFALSPTQAHISDINGGLVNLYQVIRDALPDFLEKVGTLETTYNGLSVDQQSVQFYSVRDFYNSKPRHGVDQAVNFLFLNKAGFNGIYRENRNGGFNVPFGKRRVISLADSKNVALVSTVLSRAKLSNASFDESCDGAEPGDLVYFDPPYVPLTATSAFTSYAADGFGIDEQKRLRDTFVRLDKRGVKVVLSNSSAPLVRELYDGYRVSELDATRNVSAKSHGRSPVVELVVSNY